MTLDLDNEILTEEEEAVFLGNLLGDGHIQKRKNSYRTKIEHCIKQKEYVFWKYQKLKRLCLINPKTIISKHGFESCLFYLQSGKYLHKYHKVFYEPYLWKSQICEFESKQSKIRYKKVITEELIALLPKNPLLLAVWFMDDGSSRTDCVGGRLATQGFSKQEHFLLQEYLISSFGIKTNIVFHSKAKPSFYLSITNKNNNFLNFLDLIKPIINQVPCMQYKIKNPRND